MEILYDIVVIIYDKYRIIYITIIHKKYTMDKTIFFFFLHFNLRFSEAIAILGTFIHIVCNNINILFTFQ